MLIFYFLGVLWQRKNLTLSYINLSCYILVEKLKSAVTLHNEPTKIYFFFTINKFGHFLKYDTQHRLELPFYMLSFLFLCDLSFFWIIVRHTAVIRKTDIFSSSDQWNLVPDHELETTDHFLIWFLAIIFVRIEIKSFLKFLRIAFRIKFSGWLSEVGCLVRG